MGHAAPPEEPLVRIGVLAYRGPDETGTSWSELPARLAKAIPGYCFELHELSGAKLSEAVERDELELVLTNSTQYVLLAAEYGIQRIATVRLPETVSQQQALGSAILALAGRHDIKQLADLRGKRIAAVASDAFGGYLAGARELLGAGIDLDAGDARMVYVGSPMRNAIQALRDGKADAAIVRTCLLEQLAEKGLLQAGEFKVIAPKQIDGFRCAASTPLYPDWPMAVTRAVDPQLAKQVAMALLSMPTSATGLYWDVPADYQAINDLYRDLMIGPYIDLRTTTFRGLLKTYRPHVLVVLFLFAGTVIYVIWLIRRHTAELRAAKAQTRELQKEAEHMARLSILGEMAGTLAHELNQPLATIATFAQGLARRCAAGPVDAALVAETNRENVAQTERAAIVIRRVPAFTKKRMAVRECKSIANTVEEAVALFSHLLPDLPEVTIDDWLPMNAQIEADHLQLQEVLLNLMKNAADTMRELPADEREIDISLSKGEGVVSISVADRGPPVPADTFAHLFEPFFTTKPDGLGLGLAICKSIAEAHGGRLEVEQRNPPPGLVFRINLPVGGCNGKLAVPTHPRR
ncbi:MAG: PhnD/SsuA/transferrin family substrate-binding protein [Rhodocyclaceae bacterium]|nr:PhnD/SsuA/transferrin family substrate-binding protein [Rhodocyclaceae bacterium]